MNAQVAAKQTSAPQTPSLPQAKPESIGLSTVRLQKMSDAFKREVDKGTLPGATVLVARKGQIGWFDAIGRQAPGGAPMAHDSIFRIFSMTKPIVSVGIMMLVEDGHFILSDPVAKFIPEFADQKVGVEGNGKLDLVPVKRPMTVQDLLRHTSGLTYDHTGNSLVLVKNAEGWQLEKPAYQAERSKVDELLDKLAGLRASDKDIIDKADPKTHGLEKPARVTITLEEGKDKKSKEVIFLFGKVKDKLYAQVTGWERVNGIEGDVLNLVQRSPLVYRNRKVLNHSTSDLARVEVRLPKESFARQKRGRLI